MATVTAARLRPYKVVPYEMGAADVIDRATGAKVGYVLEWANGWCAYLRSRPGEELSFGSEAVPKDLQSILGKRRDVKHTRYRKDAAERVWKDWR